MTETPALNEESNKEDSEKTPQGITVLIPTDNGYYNQPNMIPRVVSHIKEKDPQVTFEPTETQGEYILTLGEESKAFVVKGILAQQYGFLVMG